MDRVTITTQEGEVEEGGVKRVGNTEVEEVGREVEEVVEVEEAGEVDLFNEVDMVVREEGEGEEISRDPTR